MAGCRELGHVDADLGHDHLGRLAVHARDGAKQLERPRMGFEEVVDRCRDVGYGVLQTVHVGEALGGHDGMMVVEASVEGVAERRDLRTQAPLGQLGQDGRITLSGHEGLGDGPA